METKVYMVEISNKKHYNLKTFVSYEFVNAINDIDAKMAGFSQFQNHLNTYDPVLLMKWKKAGLELNDIYASDSVEINYDDL